MCAVHVIYNVTYMYIIVVFNNKYPKHHIIHALFILKTEKTIDLMIMTSTFTRT